MAAGAGVTFIFQNSDMSKHQARNVWTGLQRGIQEIQNGNASTLRFEELYRYLLHNSIKPSTQQTTTAMHTLWSYTNMANYSMTALKKQSEANYVKQRKKWNEQQVIKYANMR